MVPSLLIRSMTDASTRHLFDHDVGSSSRGTLTAVFSGMWTALKPEELSATSASSGNRAFVHLGGMRSDLPFPQSPYRRSHFVVPGQLLNRSNDGVSAHLNHLSLPSPC